MNALVKKGRPTEQHERLYHEAAERNAHGILSEPSEYADCPGNWGVVVIDKRRRVRYANASFRAALGLNHDIHGAELARLVPGSWAQMVDSVLRRAGAGPPTSAVALESQGANGAPRQLWFEAHPIAQTSLVVLNVGGIAPCALRLTQPAQAENAAAPLIGLLSPRERQVLQLVAEGLASKHIAYQLGIALTTVETYRRQIMDKLQLRTIAELTKFAIRAGLTSL